MRLTFVTTVFLTFATCPAVMAADGDRAIDSWVSGMMRRIPFKDGVFNRQALAERSQDYLAGLVTHYREIGERPRRRAEEAGNAFRVHEIENRTEIMIGQATRYVESTAAGMAATIDPSGSGHVTRKEARERLVMLAEHADSNRNGVLDRYEAALAEAAFAKGIDLARPESEATLLRDMDNSLAYWD